MSSKRRGGGGGGTNLGGLPLALPPELVVPLPLLVVVIIDEGARLPVVIDVVEVGVVDDVVDVVDSLPVIAAGIAGGVGDIVVGMDTVLATTWSRPAPLEGR